jgi:ribonuclease E
VEPDMEELHGAADATAEPVEDVVSPVLPVDSPVAVTVERMPEPVPPLVEPVGSGDGQAPAEFGEPEATLRPRRRRAASRPAGPPVS